MKVKKRPDRLRLCETLGDDLAIVQAARVSFGQGSKGEERDRRLIRYLLAHDHGTPFEMVLFRFAGTVSAETAHQVLAHPHISVAYSVVSNRYRIMGVMNARTALELMGSKKGALARAAASFLRQSCPWTYQAWRDLLNERKLKIRPRAKKDVKRA